MYALIIKLINNYVPLTNQIVFYFYNICVMMAYRAAIAAKNRRRRKTSHLKSLKLAYID